MTGDCAACGRKQWDYAKPHGDQLTCLDPATLLDSGGRPRFRLNGRGRWVHAAALPPGAFKERPFTAEHPATPPPVTPRTPQAPTGPHSHSEETR